MLPQPLHPAVVHFPLVLMFLVPLSAVLSLWLIRRGTAPLRAWSLTLVLAAALTASAFVALRTGAAEEERVELAVAESALHEHEEAGERFLVLTGILLVVAGFGLLRGPMGGAARLLTAAGAVAVIVVGVQVGGAGGELVYRYNAGSVYAAANGSAGASPSEGAVGEEGEDEDDD